MVIPQVKMGMHGMFTSCLHTHTHTRTHTHTHTHTHSHTHTHTEYFPVNLLKNRSALEIGHSGQYLLSITSSAMVLHWKTGAIAHHWPTKNISKLYHRGKEGHLLLIVKRSVKDALFNAAWITFIFRISSI